MTTAPATASFSLDEFNVNLMIDKEEFIQGYLRNASGAVQRWIAVLKECKKVPGSDLITRTEADIEKAKNTERFYQGLLDRYPRLKDESVPLGTRASIAREIDSLLTAHFMAVQSRPLTSNT